jgi:hypothetical protein
LGWWQNRPVAVVSPWPPDAAAEHLRQLLAQRPQSEFVHGRVTTGFVELWVLRSFQSNSWTPQFAGRFVSGPSGGSQLVGSFSMALVTKVLTLCWLFFLGTPLLLDVGVILMDMVTGRWTEIRGNAICGAVLVCMLCFILTLVHFASARGESDERWLREWLQQHLTQTAPS